MCSGRKPARQPHRVGRDGRRKVQMALNTCGLSHRSPNPAVLPCRGAPYGHWRWTSNAAPCMACTWVSAQGTDAGDETPRLRFLPNQTVCSAASARQRAPRGPPPWCPVISPIPRQRRRPVTLEASASAAYSAANRFSATVIDDVLDKLAGNCMFTSDRARARLQMCEDCRVVDAVQDTEAMHGLSVQTNDNAKKGNEGNEYSATPVP